ncbi:MAG: acyl-CoA dehydrogenase family protein [Acidimicrobiales bacterium]
MQNQLTDDQELFRSTSVRFLENTTSLDARRAVDVVEPLDREWWRRAAELGWTGLLIPEAHGGGSVSGAGLSDLGLVAREVGRCVAPGALVPTNVVAHTLAVHGSATQRNAVLPGIVSGSIIPAWCCDGFDAAGGVKPASMTARRTSGGVLLQGGAAPVESAPDATHFLVTANVDGGLVQALVDASAAGVHVEPARSLDLGRSFGVVRCDDVMVPDTDIVGDPGDTVEAVEGQFDLAALLICCEAVGAAERAFQFTLEYLNDRSTFGRPLASYQALKHRVADMAVHLEGSAAIVDDALAALSAKRADARRTVSAAKSYIGDHLPYLLQECVQLHGGIGLTWEHDLHLLLRRVTLTRVIYGSPTTHRERIAADLAI